MGTLLATEWLKIRKYKAFWWMTGIIALSYPGINYIFYSFYQNLVNQDTKASATVKMLGNPFTFPEVWHSVAYFSSWFIFIPSIIVIMFITNEYTFKTHRQNIIDGWSRKQFLLSKLMDVVLVSLLITIIYIIVSLVIGSVTENSSNANMWEQSYYIGYFALQTFSQLSIAFLIAFLARRAFIALGIFLFYFIILEPVVVGLSKVMKSDFGRYMPLELSDRMIPFPKFLAPIDEKLYKELVDSINQHVIYTILLVALTWGIAFWINNKRDL